jgi:hypothetical protein
MKRKAHRLLYLLRACLCQQSEASARQTSAILDIVSFGSLPPIKAHGVGYDIFLADGVITATCLWRGAMLLCARLLSEGQA